MPQIQFIDSGWLFLQRTGAADRRDSSGAALGLVLDMPVVVQRFAQFACRGRRHLCRGAEADPLWPF